MNKIDVIRVEELRVALGKKTSIILLHLLSGSGVDEGWVESEG